MIEYKASRTPALPSSPMPLPAPARARQVRGKPGTLLRSASARTWRRACAAGVVLFCAVGPIGEAWAAGPGIDIPMRRDQPTTVRVVPASAWADIESGAATVLGEIEVLRAELGIGDAPPEPEFHEDRRPSHVYVKAMEVMAKVTMFQRRLGVPVGSVRDMPLSEPSPAEVLAAVTDILDGIRAIKRQMAIETEVGDAVVSAIPTLSGAYKKLADASVLLDGLVGYSLSRSDVFRNATTVIEELNLIATKLQVVLDTEMPAVEGRKRSIDVAQQMLRAVYKAVSLQARLGMEPSAVPTLTMVRVTPTETFDMIGLLWAETARIKWHLGVNVPSFRGQRPSQKDATDLFGQTLLIIRNLDQISAGAGT